MKLKLTFLTYSLFLICLVSFGQNKYQGSVLTKLGQEVTGEIVLNLEGTNNELIEITTTEKSKSKGSKQTVKTATKLNVAIIKHIVIEKQTYYFRDIKIDYNDKYLRNVCVKLMYGTVDFGLFQSGDGKNSNSIAIKFPNEELSKLASIDFDYYNSSSAITMRISKCKPLVEKMLNDDEHVSWTEETSREQRIQRIKNIIDEYNSCELGN